MWYTSYMKQNMQKIVIYKDTRGDVKLQADVRAETLWATQAQIAKLFGTQRPAITKHLRNIFASGELKRNSVSSILEPTDERDPLPKERRKENQ